MYGHLKILFTLFIKELGEKQLIINVVDFLTPHDDKKRKLDETEKKEYTGMLFFSLIFVS